MVDSAEQQNEALTDQMPELRRFARALTLDRHAAEDVCQDALLAAWEQRRSVRGRWRPWLTSVVRRMTSGQIRAKARLQARERSAAREVEEPPTAEIVAQRQISRWIIEGVQALPEPYRVALVLRYWDGLAPRRISQRLGLPVETVRTRIKRALSQLRRGLFARADGREQWLAASVAALGSPRPNRWLLRQIGVPLAAAVIALWIIPWWAWLPHNSATPNRNQPSARDHRTWSTQATPGPQVSIEAPDAKPEEDDSSNLALRKVRPNPTTRPR